jgi:hypothetical protein
MAMTWQRGMSDLGALRVCSLAGPGHRGQQDLTYEVLSFPEAASASILGRAHSLAGFLTPTLFFLAAAIRAHDSVLRMRGTVPEGYVVPLPVDLRPKGGEGGVFRSRVSLIWLHVAADRTRDPALLLEGLKETRRRAIREHQVANGVAAMDYARYAPARLYALMTRRPMRGELCSFMFAWTGEFCPELRCFYGADVLDGFHAPSVPVSPGSSVVFSMRDGRLNVTHVRQRGVLSDGELERFREVLVRDLTGAG